MELKDFIQEALTQIIDGIKSCQHENILEASINPSGVIYSDNLGMETEIKGTRRLVQNIDFEVGITATETTNKKVGLGVFFSGAGIGGQKNGECGNTATTTLKFSIPVALPAEVTDEPKRQINSYLL